MRSGLAKPASFGLMLSNLKQLLSAAQDSTRPRIPCLKQPLTFVNQPMLYCLELSGGRNTIICRAPCAQNKGLLRLRKHFDLFANLRPATVFPELAHASTLKPEFVAGLDLLILRELTSDIYFGQPRGIHQNPQGLREGFDTMRYNEAEISRIAHVGFQTAMKRQRRLCSVDKANVLETTQLWREVMIEIARDYPDVELSHMYVDNAAMQLVRRPKQFDVIVTGNMFGDILSDEASMLTRFDWHVALSVA